jgi:hypothetical protein
VLALMLFASTAVGNPQLDTSNPTSFFTNVAMAMFQQMDLRDFNGDLVTVTNIPIYEDPTVSGGANVNYYTPAVHRVLQLAANIYDATTNRFIGGGPTNYPTVFRPIFSSENGVVRVIGYQEVTNSFEAFLPMLNASDFVQVNQPVNSSVNMYGVPWVIGARKGFPNFNEFSMENALTVFRKLQFTNVVAHPPWMTNQVYELNLTNTFGVEAWNSYTNVYGRSLRLVVSNVVNIVVSNETGLPLLVVTNLAFGSDISFTGWPGWSNRLTDTSFKVPLMASWVFTNGIYGKTLFIPLNPPVWDVTFVPRLWMTLQNKLRYVLIDTSADRVIDFVNIVKTEPAVNIAGVLNNGAAGIRIDTSTEDGQWNTNLIHGIENGIYNQIQTSLNPSSLVWKDTAANKFFQANNFNEYLNDGGASNFQAPFTPHRTIYQRVSMEANDPLVHYTATDITSTNGSAQIFYNGVYLTAKSPPLATISNLNFSFQPWGGMHLNGGSDLNPNQFRVDWRVKDPHVQQSDEWNFPNGESFSFEWLGRVHRGTPWQTVFLKSSGQTVGQWLNWNNDNVLITNGNRIFVDAVFSHPNNDWHFASLWAQWLNTNDLSTRLSINSTDTKAWAARLDGLTALTNSAVGELDSITITSNSPQAEIIAQGIQTARANIISTNGIGFQNVGDVLATPQLSVASPFVDTNGLNSLSAYGLTDEALEKIPTQLLPLLRADSFGRIAPVDGQLKLSFSGYDGHVYVIEASSNLIDWVAISTNCPLDGSFGITNAATFDQQYYRSVLRH